MIRTKTFRQRREELGLTQRQVAEAAEITDQTVSNCERMGYSPILTARQFARLCRLMDVSIDELADLLETPPQEGDRARGA